MEADSKRLEVLAKLDSVGEVSQWVNNTRALMRPVLGGMIVAAYVSTLYMPTVMDAIAANLASAVVFYLFGDRTYLHFKRK